MLPNWHAAPFPFFYDIRFGFVDELADMGHHLAAPITKLGDALGDVFGGGQQYCSAEPCCSVE